jgi:hypothetical protein
VKSAAAPERVNWPAVRAVIGGALILVVTVALVAGFTHARNWPGVAIVLAVFAALMGAGRVAERTGLRHTRRPQ